MKSRNQAAQQTSFGAGKLKNGASESFPNPVFLEMVNDFCVGAFYWRAMASILILSHSDIFDDVLCWCLLQASSCKHFDLSTFLIQKYLMMFCVGAFYRQALGKGVVWHHLSKTSKHLCPGLSLPPLLVNSFANVPPMVLSLYARVSFGGKPISHKCCSKCSLGIMCHVLELSGSICKASFSSSIYCNANLWQALGISFVSLHSMQAKTVATKPVSLWQDSSWG